MSHIIGLTGRIGVGKSFAAKVLHARGYQRVRFAGPLKAMMRQLGLTDEHIEGALKEVPCALLGGKTPRYAMQTIGTEWGRDMISPSLWIDVWKERVKSLDLVVTEDVRFPNEAEAVRALGGVLVRIERGDTFKPAHASEVMDFAADIVIRNDSDLSQFREDILGLLETPYAQAA